MKTPQEIQNRMDKIESELEDKNIWWLDEHYLEAERDALIWILEAKK